ncbi:hypothetical protein BC829DRAFT_418754 [Chytridium lagenaria]|nr:hypothetical protein BC829DRAFT_418754 [Chytridium lagenaria]
MKISILTASVALCSLLTVKISHETPTPAVSITPSSDVNNAQSKKPIPASFKKISTPPAKKNDISVEAAANSDNAVSAAGERHKKQHDRDNDDKKDRIRIRIGDRKHRHHDSDDEDDDKHHRHHDSDDEHDNKHHKKDRIKLSLGTVNATTETVMTMTRRSLNAKKDGFLSDDFFGAEKKTNNKHGFFSASNTLGASAAAVVDENDASPHTTTTRTKPVTVTTRNTIVNAPIDIEIKDRDRNDRFGRGQIAWERIWRL